MKSYDNPPISYSNGDSIKAKIGYNPYVIPQSVRNSFSGNKFHWPNLSGADLRDSVKYSLANPPRDNPQGYNIFTNPMNAAESLVNNVYPLERNGHNFPAYIDTADGQFNAVIPVSRSDWQDAAIDKHGFWAGTFGSAGSILADEFGYPTYVRVALPKPDVVLPKPEPKKSKTTRELWEEKTGLPWSAAQELGESDGTLQSNLALRKRLTGKDSKDYARSLYEEWYDTNYNYKIDDEYDKMIRETAERDTRHIEDYQREAGAYADIEDMVRSNTHRSPVYFGDLSLEDYNPNAVGDLVSFTDRELRRADRQANRYERQARRRARRRN